MSKKTYYDHGDDWQIQEQYKRDRELSKAFKIRSGCSCPRRIVLAFTNFFLKGVEKYGIRNSQESS